MDYTTKEYRDLLSLDAACFVTSLIEAGFDPARTADVFGRKAPNSPSRQLVERTMRTRAAQPAISLSPSDIGAMPDDLAAALVADVDRISAFGRVLAVARRLPFNMRTLADASPLGGAGWGGHGGGVVVLHREITSTWLSAFLAIALIVLTLESVRGSGAVVLRFVRDLIVLGLANFLDSTFVDPALAAGDRNPASITFGAPSVPSSGSSAAAAVEDFGTMLSTFVAAGGELAHAVVLLSSANAVALNLTGHSSFKDLQRDGGRVAGLPAFASAGVGDVIVILDVSKLLIAAEDRLDVSLARSASLEMRDDPVGSSTTPTAATQVSLFQNNLVALKVGRPVSWQTLDGAVAFIEGANYLGGSPA